MSKKLLSLVLVLALAGMASALQWIGPAYTDTTPGDWADGSNWNGATGTEVPVASDATTQDYRGDGLGANTIITSACSGGVKPQWKFGSIKTEITSTGSLSNDGSVEMSSTLTLADIKIDAGGVWNACQKLNTTTGTMKVSSNTAGAAYIDVYGTLNVKGSLANSDLQLGQATNLGIGRVYIENGGMVDADAYGINGALVASGTYAGLRRGQIQIYQGGIMRIKGDVLAQINGDIAAGNIVGLYGGQMGLTVWRAVYGATTYTLVPEPATIALLGLGSLTLLRRKR